MSKNNFGPVAGHRPAIWLRISSAGGRPMAGHQENPLVSKKLRFFILIEKEDEIINSVLLKVQRIMFSLSWHIEINNKPIFWPWIQSWKNCFFSHRPATSQNLKKSIFFKVLFPFKIMEIYGENKGFRSEIDLTWVNQRYSLCETIHFLWFNCVFSPKWWLSGTKFSFNQSTWC